MLSNIRIVLVHTFHSGNIGSAARAMKTMGLTDLYLVSPKDFQSDNSFNDDRCNDDRCNDDCLNKNLLNKEPLNKGGKQEALKMAMSADDVVNDARIVDSLYEAVKDCTVVIASTARSRGYDLPELSPEECATKLYETVNNASNTKVALVFGPERMGLSNDDLQLAKYRVTIPTSPDYSSLNLAAAVQTLGYEIFKQTAQPLVQSQEKEEVRNFPTAESLEQLYTHMEATLDNTGFIIKKHPGEIMQKLRNVFTRAELDESEVNILRGVLSSVDRRIDGAIDRTIDKKVTK